MGYDNDREIYCKETDSGEQLYEVTYERGETVSVVVAGTVAALEERDPTECPPLHGAVDADALDSLIEHAWKRSVTDLEVAFTYAGYRIEIDHPGSVRIGSVG